MLKNIGLISLGCPKNLVDSEIMLGLLETAGYRITNDPSKADFLIVNTCGFIKDSKKESIDAILEMAGYKRSARAKYLIVTGCLPQRYKKELFKLFPEVDLFIGTGEYSKIVSFIKKLESCGKRKLSAEDMLKYIGVPEYIHTYKTPRKISTSPHAVYIKIAEGCFHACSFCAIPIMRGKYRSRQTNDIISEAKLLLKSGAKELNIIAQDTTAYGRDLKTKDNIVSLLRNLAELPGDKWVRMMYAYPQTFKKDIIRLMKENSQVCKYVDMPIQHIDDTVLYNMRRARSETKVRDIISYIKNELPEVALRTSIITGFPGETDKQFKKLLDFVSEGYFDHVGVFSYSEEEGTRAAMMKDQVPEKIKEGRRREIMKVQKKISRMKLNNWCKKRIKVLVEGVSPETDFLLQGRTEFQAPDIDGVTYINDGEAKAGDFYWVEITDTYDYDLVGRVV